MWVRGTPITNGTLLKVGVLTSSSPTGPWKWALGMRGQSGIDPMHLVAGKHQYGDATLWQDPDNGKAYVYWRARTTDISGGFCGMELNEDCTDVVIESDTRIFDSPNREAPSFFKHKGKFYLWASGTLGWTPVQAYVYKGETALGPFNASLGHGWHAYTKDGDFNSTHQYVIRAGYLPAGHDFCQSQNTTINAAKDL